MRAMLAGLAAVVGCTPFTAPEEVSYERTLGAETARLLADGATLAVSREPPGGSPTAG